MGLDLPIRRIEIQCFPRVLGHVFNPLSVWFCFGPDDVLLAVLCEVHNTFGERHSYLLHHDGEPMSWPVRHAHGKQFHVSPFVGMEADYRFRFARAGDESSTVIHEYQDDRLMLVAVQRGEARALTDANLLTGGFDLPLPHPQGGRPHPLAGPQDLAAWCHLFPQARAAPGGDFLMSAEELIDLPSETQSRRVALWAWIFGRFCRRLAFGSLLLRFGTAGARLYRGPFPGGSAELRIQRPLRLLLRILTRGEIGFAESYMEQDWSTPDLPALLDLLNLNAEHLAGAVDGLTWSRRLDRLTHRLRDNDRRNSRRNIASHYDLGNDFYRLWLDPGMTYSSAVFEDPVREPLGAAQTRKYERLLDWIDARPGESVLEIGCGWGGFAEAAAGAASRLPESPCLRRSSTMPRRASLRRVLRGRWSCACRTIGTSRAASTTPSLSRCWRRWGRYWPTYFPTLRRLVRPGGRIAIQVITMHEDDFARYRRCADFIQLYIFPGGMLPSRTGWRRRSAPLG